MSSRRRSHRRRATWDAAEPKSIAIRVGDRRSRDKYHEVQVFGSRDAGRFARVIDEQVLRSPNDPLIIAINGYQTWLDDVLHSCIEDHGSEVPEIGRAVQYANTMQFPEKASRRGHRVPWTFIIDHMNVPQVYYWSVGLDPPRWEDKGLPAIETFRFRSGVWFCGYGAYKRNRKVPVTIIFTKPSTLSDNIVTRLMFDYLWGEDDIYQPRDDEEGICCTFLRLNSLFTDWQNIIGEVHARLDESEINSQGRHLAVKIRTRRMHTEVDRIFELKEYLHFHTRSFKKLQRLKTEVPDDEQGDPLWNDLDDAVEDLEQFDSTLDGLKERFNNLIELEFNITNATQSDNSAFLSAVATLFLPISFLASLFGMTTVTWPPIWYLYVALPAFVVSAAFTALFPWFRKRFQYALEPVEERHLHLQPNQFTLLGEDYPDNVNAPNSTRQGRFKHQAKATSGQKLRSQSRRRSQSRKRSRSRKGSRTRMDSEKSDR